MVLLFAGAKRGTLNGGRLFERGRKWLTGNLNKRMIQALIQGRKSDTSLLRHERCAERPSSQGAIKRAYAAESLSCGSLILTLWRCASGSVCTDVDTVILLIETSSHN